MRAARARPGSTRACEGARGSRRGPGSCPAAGPRRGSFFTRRSSWPTSEAQPRLSRARPRSSMPRVPGLEQVASLTSSEERVADLAADGLSNRDIRADALRHAEDRRGAPDQRVSVARHRLQARAAGRAGKRHRLTGS
jgi:hypothetical protein